MTTIHPVTRGELLDYQTYGEQRRAIRAAVLAIKDDRRLELGAHLTLLFENRDTIRYQIQEMMRLEQLVREDAIGHELDTYNELLGGPGELGATLLIAVQDTAEPDLRMTTWVDLPASLYARFDDGSQAFAQYDERQITDGRISTVQFLKFPCAGRTPIAFGTDFPALACEVPLTTVQRQALTTDLTETQLH